jgi:hypothetical protein
LRQSPSPAARTLGLQIPLTSWLDRFSDEERSVF